MTEKKLQLKKSSSSALKNPRITEKSSMLSSKGNVYTFDIPSGFNKLEIKKAISDIYKVKPIRVNIIPVPGKRITYRGKPGVKRGGKKALVYLKPGDKIEFV